MNKIMLVEDKELVRRAVGAHLSLDPKFSLVEAESSRQTISELIRHQEVELMILEIGIEGGMLLIEESLALRPELNVIIFSDIADMDMLRRAFFLGASAYVLKECLEDELLLSIKCVMAGRKFICSGIASLLTREQLQVGTCARPTINCSEREIEVLRLLEQGMTNREISDTLFLSKRTVEGHRQNLLEKSGSRNTAQLISFAIKSRLI